jgi:hypothetical protein
MGGGAVGQEQNDQKSDSSVVHIESSSPTAGAGQLPTDPHDIHEWNIQMQIVDPLERISFK